jgi:EAL domain-containing protein (putative c-di-GMP-specific phosphodiesterase class I)/CheY-like chemotaxis protein
MREDAMNHQPIEDAPKLATFGQRKVAPRACIADGKQHVRTFLASLLEEFGFIAGECSGANQLSAALDAQLPDLVVLGLSAGEVEVGNMIETLAIRKFGGKVLLLGPPDSPVVVATRRLGENLGITILPTLATPFRGDGLRDSIASLLPPEAPPSPPIDAAEAIRAGWLELWYQPKVDTQTLALHGAEGLIRIRHPTWGIVRPAYFVANDGDPHFRGLSEFVISRAIDDWHYFLSQYGPMQLSINLPIEVFQDPEAVKLLCLQMPDRSDFEGMIIEINGTEAVRHLDLLKEVAGQLRFHKIAISIDDLGAEWPSLVGIHDFPFVKLKVDRKFIAGCADDRLKRTFCRQILDLADGYGARTVAEGVETRADFLAVREMGFDLVQGFLFAKPMPAKKFARTMLGRPITASW